MLTRSHILSYVLLGSFLFVGGATVQAGTIQGSVKGPDGKPVNGAEVHIARKSSKESLNSVKTDKKGTYVFNGLAVGSYKVTAWVNRVPTTVDNVRARADGAVRVDFDIKPGAAKVVAKKKATHLVWVPAETGTHIGGGQWIEVNDDGTIPTGQGNLNRASGESLRNIDAGRQTTPNLPAGN